MNNLMQSFYKMDNYNDEIYQEFLCKLLIQLNEKQNKMGWEFQMNLRISFKFVRSRFDDNNRVCLEWSNICWFWKNEIRSLVCSLGVSAFLWNGTWAQLILRFLTFLKHIESCIYVCLSSYAKVVLVPRNENAFDVLYLRTGIYIAYSIPKRANPDCVSRTHLAFHVSRSRTGPRYLYQVTSSKKWKFKSCSPFLGTVHS
jgi:hypothetical protein